MVPWGQGDKEMEDMVSSLHNAIREGKVGEAQQFAGKLAEKRAVIDMILEPQDTTKDKLIDVKIIIEDKHTSTCKPIHWTVKVSTKIYQLKRLMFKEKGFPIDIQRWIVEKRIPADNDSLSSCGVSTDDHTIFLYLMSTKPKTLHPGLEGDQGDHRFDLQPASMTGAQTMPSQPSTRRTPREGQYRSMDPTPHRSMEGTPRITGATGGATGGNAGGPTSGAAAGGGGAWSMEASAGAASGVGGAIGGAGGGSPLEGAVGGAPIASLGQLDEDYWSCDGCTLKNHPALQVCEVCEKPRPPLEGRAASMYSTPHRPHDAHTQRPPDATIPQRPTDATLPQRPTDATVPQRPTDATVPQRPLDATTTSQRPSDATTTLQRPSDATRPQRPTLASTTPRRASDAAHPDRPTVVSGSRSPVMRYNSVKMQYEVYEDM